MDINKFIKRNPYLYHLTDKENAGIIMEQRRILSTVTIINASNIPDKNTFLRKRRPDHTTINIDGVEYKIRDQRPISILALSKCVTDNWDTGDFIYHLNRRVFLWPNLKRLQIHYQRYQDEKPVIFRFSSQDILNIHPNAEFCRLNSGATRANSHLGGKAPERGKDTFQIASAYTFPVSSVAEVTIPDYCTLPTEFDTSGKPNGPWDSYSY